jgi:ATP-dependent DNA helicase RecG
MLYRESETVELKEIVVDDIKQSVIAFANSKGGTLYIGISDKGEVTGVTDPDGTLLQVNNMLRDAIKPDITMFMQSGIEVIRRQGSHCRNNSTRDRAPLLPAREGYPPGGCLCTAWGGDSSGFRNGHTADD